MEDMPHFLNVVSILLILLPFTHGQYQTLREATDYNDFPRQGLSQTAQFARTLSSATGGYPSLYPAYGAYDTNLIDLNRVNGLGGLYAPRARPYYLPPPMIDQPYRLRPRYGAYESYPVYTSYNVPAYSYADSGYETQTQPGMLKGAFDGAIRGTLAGAFGL